MEHEDHALVTAYLGGDRGAAETLILRYERLVFNIARRMVGKPEDARDVAQNVFLEAFEHLATFDARYPFRSWLGRIAVNESLDHLAARKTGEPLDEAWPASGPGPGEVMNGIDLSRVVEGALLRLKPDLRAVVLLRYFMDLSYREIGSLLEVPEKTVKSRLFTSRQVLRDLLAGHGAVESWES